MIELRFANIQWHDPEGKWPYQRTSMFTVMDAEGRTVAIKLLDEDGQQCLRNTYYHRHPFQQHSYPLGIRIGGWDK